MPLEEFPDNVPWLRAPGDEIVDLRSYIPQEDDLKVTPCEVAPMALDISGVPMRVEVLDDEITPPRLRLVPPAPGDSPLLPLVATNPEGSLFHVGSIFGLLVADPARYRSEVYRNWVGRFPFNESPLDDLTAHDFSPLSRGAFTSSFNAHPDQRVWDDSRGWVLKVEPYGTTGSATFYHTQTRGISTAFTATFWVKISELTRIPMLLTYGSMHISIDEPGPLIIGFVADAGRTDDSTVAVAAMVKNQGATEVILGGDNNYPHGASATMDENIGRHWRKYIFPYTGDEDLKAGEEDATENHLWPVLGNHDWETSNRVLGPVIGADAGGMGGSLYEYDFDDDSPSLRVGDIIRNETTGQRYVVSFVMVNGAGTEFEERYFEVAGEPDIFDFADVAINDGPHPHLRYFALPNNERYYVKTFGDLDVFFLSSDDEEPDGNTIGSTQYTWFVAQVAASTARFKAVVFHHAAKTSGSLHNAKTEMNWGWAGFGIDFVLQGHQHQYERWEEDGVIYFTVGTGSDELYSFDSSQPAESKKRLKINGALLVSCLPSRIDFTFRDVNGVVRDARTIEKEAEVTPPTTMDVVLRVGNSLAEARRPIQPDEWTFVAVTLQNDTWSLGVGTSELSALSESFSAPHTFEEDEESTEFFVYDGTPNGYVTLERHLVRPDTVSVKVDGVGFSVISTLLNAKPGERVFVLSKHGLEGHTLIRFGDGVNGAYVPENAVVEVTYKVRQDGMVIISDDAPAYLHDLHLFSTAKTVAHINSIGFPALRSTSVPYARLRLQDQAGRQEYDFQVLDGGLVYAQLAEGVLENHQQQWAVVTRYNGEGRYTGDPQFEQTGHSGRIGYHNVIGGVATQVGQTINLSAPLAVAITNPGSNLLIIRNQLVHVLAASAGATSLTVYTPSNLDDHYFDGLPIYGATLAAYTLGQVYADAWDGEVLRSFNQGQPLGRYGQSLVVDSNPYIRRFYVAGTIAETAISASISYTYGSSWELEYFEPIHVPKAGNFYRYAGSSYSYRCVEVDGTALTFARIFGRAHEATGEPVLLCRRGVFEVTLQVVGGVPTTQIRQLVRLSGTVTTDLPNINDQLYTLEPWSASAAYDNTSVVSHEGRYFLRRFAPTPAVSAFEPQDAPDMWLEVPSLEALEEADYGTDAVLEYVAYGSRLEVVPDGDGWALEMQPTEELYAELQGNYATIEGITVTRFFNPIHFWSGSVDATDESHRLLFEEENPGFQISYDADTGITTIRYGGLYGDLVGSNIDGFFPEATVDTHGANSLPVFVYATEVVEVAVASAAARYAGSTWQDSLPALSEAGTLPFSNTETLVAGRYRLELDVQNLGLLDQDFDGFQVEIEIGRTDPRTIIRGNLLSEPSSQRDPRETAILEFTLSEAITCGWTLNLRWTNAITNDDNWQRVLAVHGYSLIRLTCERYVLNGGYAGAPTFTAITVDEPPLTGHGDANLINRIQGAWKVSLRADGTPDAWTPESEAFSEGAKVPHALTLTATTGEKSEHIHIPQGYLPDPAIIADDVVALDVTGGGSPPYSLRSTLTFSVHSSDLHKVEGADIAWRFWDGEVVFGGTTVQKMTNMRQATAATYEVAMFALKPNGQQLKGIIGVNFKGSVLVKEITLTKEDDVVPYTGVLTVHFDGPVPENTTVNLYRSGNLYQTATALTGATTRTFNYTINLAGVRSLEIEADSAGQSRFYMETTVIGREAVAPVISPIIRAVPAIRVGERFYPGTATIRYQFSCLALDPQGSDGLTTAWTITPSLPLSQIEEDAGGDLIKTSVHVNMQDADPEIDYLLTCTATSALGTVARSRMVFRPVVNNAPTIDFIRLTCGQDVLTMYDADAVYKKGESVIYRNRIYTSTYVPANATQAEAIAHPSPDVSLAYWRLTDTWSIEAGVRLLLEAQASDPDNDSIYNYIWQLTPVSNGLNVPTTLSGPTVVLPTLSAGCSFISSVVPASNYFITAVALTTGTAVAFYGTLPITFPRMTSAKTYYVRLMGTGTYRIYPTQAEALAGSGHLLVTSAPYEANSAIMECKSATHTGTSQITGTLSVRDGLLLPTVYTLPTINVRTRCATPFIRPAGGSQGSDQPVTVTMSCPTVGAVIRYQVGAAPTDPNRTSGQIYTPATGRKETTLLTCPSHDINYLPLFGVEPVDINDPFYGTWFDLVGPRGRARFYYANYTGNGRATTPPPISATLDADALEDLSMVPADRRVEIPVIADQLLESSVAELTQRYIDADSDFVAVIDGSGTGANVIVTDAETGSRELGGVMPDSGFVMLRLTAGSLVPGTALEVPIGQTVKAIAYRADLLESRVVEVNYAP